MRESDIPELTFPMVEFGKYETPWDLRTLLYQGGAGALSNKVTDLIAKGSFGAPIPDRLPLVKKLYEAIAGKLAGGGSRHTTSTTIQCLRTFFSWADGKTRSMTLESVESMYIDWIDHLLHRQQVDGDIKEKYVRHLSTLVAQILGEALELRVGLLIKTRIRKPTRKTRVLGTQTNKQNLEQTFIFGNALLDIINALSVKTIQGTLPVKIPFRTGQVIEEWSCITPTDRVKSLVNEPTDSSSRFRRKVAIRDRDAWEADTSLRTRYPLVNLRIQAEMLAFIAQTGMNLAQAHTLKISKFRYQSHLDGYRVHRVYKGRRQGEVAFEIFSEYRAIFEHYLAWRKAMFPGDHEGLLFPLVRRGGEQRMSVQVLIVLLICARNWALTTFRQARSARRGSTGCCAFLAIQR